MLKPIIIQAAHFKSLSSPICSTYIADLPLDIQYPIISKAQLYEKLMLECRDNCPDIMIYPSYHGNDNRHDSTVIKKNRTINPDILILYHNYYNDEYEKYLDADLKIKINYIKRDGIFCGIEIIHNDNLIVIDDNMIKNTLNVTTIMQGHDLTETMHVIISRLMQDYIDKYMNDTRNYV